MTTAPRKLQQFLDTLREVGDRQDRIELLIGLADRYSEVPAAVARRPFARENLVPHCESEAYFWPVDRHDGTLELYFAIENPQGISARAMAVILHEGLSGEPLEEVARVSDDLPFEVFGHELSMGKSMGLNGMVAMVRLAARKRLENR